MSFDDLKGMNYYLLNSRHSYTWAVKIIKKSNDFIICADEFLMCNIKFDKKYTITRNTFINNISILKDLGTDAEKIKKKYIKYYL